MTTLHFLGARYFAEPGERIVVAIQTDSDRVAGIVTLRPNGLYYASALERVDYEIPEWSEMKSILSRSIVAGEDEGRRLVESAFTTHGHRVTDHVKPERTLLDALAQTDGADFDFDPPRIEIKLKSAKFD